MYVYIYFSRCKNIEEIRKKYFSYVNVTERSVRRQVIPKKASVSAWEFTRTDRSDSEQLLPNIYQAIGILNNSISSNSVKSFLHLSEVKMRKWFLVESPEKERERERELVTCIGLLVSFLNFKTLSYTGRNLAPDIYLKPGQRHSPRIP